MNQVYDKVSIVIITYNSMPPLENCLKSLQTNTNGTPLEVVNVDNCSSDNSADIIKEYFPKAKVIRNKDNLGFGVACNQAAENATGDFLLFLNPDVSIDKHAVENLQDVIRSKENAGTVVGRMRFPDGSFQSTCRKFPNYENMVFSRGSAFAKYLGNGNKYTLPDYDSVTPVPASAGAMMMIRRDLFEKIGGFDNRFFMFMEDVDLCNRLNESGYVNYYAPEAGGVHLWGKGSKASKFKRNLYHHFTVWKYFTKYKPGIVSYCLLPLILSINLLLISILPVPQPINRK